MQVSSQHVRSIRSGTTRTPSEFRSYRDTLYDTVYLQTRSVNSLNEETNAVFADSPLQLQARNLA